MQTTAYSRVAAALRDEILAGAWHAGQQLPTEQLLCERFGASRITIRRALQILEQEMLIRRQQGAGTFVHSDPARKIPLLSTDFFGSIAQHAPELNRRVLRHGRSSADAALQTTLQLLPDEEVVNALRVDSVRDEPVATDQLYLRARIASALKPDDFAVVDFLGRWQQVEKISFAYCTQSIEAEHAQKPVTEYLEVRGGSPVLKETNVVYAADGAPAGLFITHYRHDVFRFEATVDFGRRNGKPRI